MTNKPECFGDPEAVCKDDDCDLEPECMATTIAYCLGKSTEELKEIRDTIKTAREEYNLTRWR